MTRALRSIPTCAGLRIRCHKIMQRYQGGKTMTFATDNRRAHNVLHGQTLLDEWQARNKICAEGNKICAEGNKLWTEGHKLYAEGNKLYAEGNKLRAEGNKLYAEGNKLWTEGNKLWTEAVLAEFGPACTITWDTDPGGCTLSNGERYELI